MTRPRLPMGRSIQTLDDADYVIVGTGAGGATAARVLSEAGHSVVMLEEGPELSPATRPRALLDAMAQAMRDIGTLGTAAHVPFPLVQGRAVGGSTAINSGIIWRMPEPVRHALARDYGLEELLDAAALERIYGRIEDELEVDEVDEAVMGGNGELMRRGAEALGLRGQKTARNARRCRGRARCLQGCPEGARQSMEVSYVPRAQAHGARLHAGFRVRQVEFEGRVARAVVGERVDEDGRRVGGRVRVRARRGVILSAGAIHSPLILRNSGLRARVGDGFTAHPGAAVVGRFEHSVGMGFGATQSYQVPLFDRGLKLESLSLPPELLAARIPGSGDVWSERLRHLDDFAQWATIARARARGRVRSTLGGRPRVDYELTAEDVAMMQRGIALLAAMLFAAGACEVYPGVSGLPEVLTGPEQVSLITARPLKRQRLHLMASHLFGGACAGSDPARSVVDPELRVHGVEGLHVMDASVFPDNLGVNPQHSIMAVAYHAAERLAEAQTN
ncbi:MAG: GMC family oxidoreductase [Myxococcales bacterium]|nr:GMC family oxidoreductase [Myxococcales bacterium]